MVSCVTATLVIQSTHYYGHSFWTSSKTAIQCIFSCKKNPGPYFFSPLVTVSTGNVPLYCCQGSYFSLTSTQQDMWILFIFPHRSHSVSPLSSRKRHVGSRVMLGCPLLSNVSSIFCICVNITFIVIFFHLQDNPESSNCLGIFGLSLYTTERDLRQYFEKYGGVESIQIVYDRQVRNLFCYDVSVIIYNPL